MQPDSLFMSHTVERPLTFVHAIGRAVIDVTRLVGDVWLFGWRMLWWLKAGWPRGSVLWPIMDQIGVQSLSVILITGSFIGMVLTVQAYDQFALMNMESQLGTVVNVTLVKELGPVLAALMLAGRVGSAIAAELGTMRVTEQIDALTVLGANPVSHLVVPRFLACVFLIPALTLFADGVGVLTGWMFSTQILDVDSYYYWHYSRSFVTGFDVIQGILKSILFGGAIAIISCHRGFHSGAGAEGVGRAATEAFVFSFVTILIIDFLMGTFLMEAYFLIFPRSYSMG